MNLSFSTRGWQSLGYDAWVKNAREMHFNGIELYNVFAQEELFEKGGALHRYKIAASVRKLQENGLCIPCLDSALDLSDGKEDTFLRLLRLSKLAGELGCPYVAARAVQGEEGTVSETVQRFLEETPQTKVTLLIRTGDMFSDTKRLRSLLDSFASDRLAVLWDIHYPLRDAGESPAETITNLGAYVRHVHLRDSDENGNQLLGEGSMPLPEIMRALSSVNYDGFFSLEWKPEWMPEVQDHEIIFPHFINFMSRFSSTRGKRRRFYPNFDGSGEYIWKENELISLNFSQVLDQVADAFPDQYAFKYTTLDYTRTYAQFREDVDRFARALISLGVKAGSKVAVWATNVPAWYIAFWATTKLGAVLVTVNTAYKIHEAEYLLRQSDTHTLIMIESCLDSDYRSIINELCPELADTKPGTPLHCRRLPFLRNVITVGFRESGCLTFEQAMERAESVRQEELLRMASLVRTDDVCNMQYTSGTTGFPKGVMLTHYNVINNGKCIGDRMGLSTADRMMLQVPMFHCFGMVLSMTAAMTHGATLCPLPYFSAKAALACIQQERITCFNGVPTMFIAMFNHADYRRTDFSYMRTGIMAGAGCPPELMKRAAQPDEMNMRGIVSVYGQTESAPGNTMSVWTDPLELRCNTVGRAMSHVECKIIDPESGKILGDGENGEFCSRGYNTMKGYYKMPDATYQAVDSEGWLHSGDLACREESGYYRITGRLKDMIIRGGENLYPKEIEEFIYTHPKVRDVQVIGVPDKRYGEEAMACIILKDGEEVSEEEMRAYITASLARHKVPRYIVFTDAFPMNAAGKVLKYKMREEAIRQLGLA